MQSHVQDTSQSMEWSEEEKYEHVILDVKNLVTKFLREYVAENLLSFYENVSNEFFVIYGQKKNIFLFNLTFQIIRLLRENVCLKQTEATMNISSQLKEQIWDVYSTSF